NKIDSVKEKINQNRVTNLLVLCEKVNKFALDSLHRKVLEWLKRLPWKGSIRVTVSRVRIPSFLQLLKLKRCKSIICIVFYFLGDMWGDVFCFLKLTLLEFTN